MRTAVVARFPGREVLQELLDSVTLEGDPRFYWWITDRIAGCEADPERFGALLACAIQNYDRRSWKPTSFEVLEQSAKKLIPLLFSDPEDARTARESFEECKKHITI